MASAAGQHASLKSLQEHGFSVCTRTRMCVCDSVCPAEGHPREQGEGGVSTKEDKFTAHSKGACSMPAAECSSHLRKHATPAPAPASPSRISAQGAPRGDKFAAQGVITGHV